MKDQLTEANPATSKAGLEVFLKILAARSDNELTDAFKMLQSKVASGEINRKEESGLEMVYAQQAVLCIRASERRKDPRLSTELAKGYVSWFELSQVIVGVSAKVVTVTEQDRNSYSRDFSEVEVFTYEPDYIKARAFEELQGYLPADIDAAQRKHYDYLRSRDCYASMMNGAENKEETTIFGRVLELFYPEDKREYIGRG